MTITALGLPGFSPIVALSVDGPAPVRAWNASIGGSWWLGADRAYARTPPQVSTLDLVGCPEDDADVQFRMIPVSSPCASVLPGCRCAVCSLVEGRQ